MVNTKQSASKANLEHEPYRSVRALVAHLRSSPTDEPAGLRGLLFVRGKLGGLHLEGEDLAMYRSAAQRVVDEGAKHAHLSKNQSEGFLQDAILEALDIRREHQDVTDDARTTESLHKLAERLTTPPFAHRVYVPLDGLVEESLPHKFGGVEFVKGREARRAILAPIGNRKAAHAEAERLRKRFPAATAMCEVLSGDHADAGERARRRIAEVLDVLNFYGDILEAPLGRHWISVRGQRHQEWCNASVTSDSSNVNFSDRWFPVSLPAATSERATALGYWRVSELLAKENRSKLERRLITALRHAGRATVAVEPERAVLGYVIALETALIGKVGGGGKLAIRTAHVIATKLENRKKIMARVGSLYEMRSKIVHSGSLEASTDDVAHARRYAKEAVLHLILDEPYSSMLSESELENYFDECILGGTN